MTDNFIQLKKDETLKLNIKDEDGNDTGNYLEFDLEDIELPLKYQELVEKDKKNKEMLRNQLLIIEKREDVKGKKLLSKNEEDKIKALNDFYKKQVEVYNIFLGEQGFEKLTNYRKIRWSTFDEVDEIITKQIIPYLDISLDKLTNKIKEKYSTKDIIKHNDPEENVLE